MATVSHHDGPHTTSDKLEDQAASAALYVSRESPNKSSPQSALDEDGKLSSAGAATSLKYAKAQDLPSFPSTGGVKMSSAGAAASLADSNKKPFEHWKPSAIPAANLAATRAKDYEMDPLWEPEMSKAGSKAATLAHKDAHSVDIWHAPESEAGHSAAGQAFGKPPPGPITQSSVSADSHRKALLAATGAMSSNRKRADSAPIKPKNDNAAWALKAATSSHKAQPSGQQGEFTTGDPGFEAARVQNMAKNNVNRQMYGSNPPVQIEVEEKNRQDTLRASAIAMAQKMYAVQQQHIDTAKGGRGSDSHYAANRARNRALSDASSDAGSDVKATPRYEGLEEAARRLAQERLSKLRDEHAEYRDYYGQNTTAPKSRLSLRHRNRASSHGENEDDSDEEQSRRIRGQMSIFQNKLAEVDGKKRQADRDALLEAAHKNVTAQMNAMDDKIFQTSGKASPQQRELWERQARERAQKDSDERMVNVGKVHIGGGKYLEQAEVEAIARARLQPTFDEISEKAEKQRAADEERRLDQERQKAELETQKRNEAEIKAQNKASIEKEKREEKNRKTEEKRVQKEEAAAEKAKRQADAAAEKERARQEKEEKRKSRDNKPGKFSLLNKGPLAATALGATGVASIEGPIDSQPGTVDTEAANKHVDEPAPDMIPADRSKASEPVQEILQEIDDEEAAKKKDGNVVSNTAEGEAKDDNVISKESETKAEDDNSVPEASETKAEDENLVPDAPETKAEDETVIPSATEPKTKDESVVPGATESEAKDDSVVPSATEPKAKDESVVPSATEAKAKDVNVVPVVRESGKQPTSPEKSDSKVKSWFKSRFRTPNKAQNETEDKPTGAGTITSTKTKTSAADDKPRSNSMRDVALAGRTDTKETDDMYGNSGEPVSPVKDTGDRDAAEKDRSGSPVSSLHSQDHPKKSTEQPTSDPAESESEARGRSGYDERPVQDEKDAEKSSPTGKADEDDFEEARDQFDEEKLSPPPKLPNVTTGSPVGSRERSKFKEEL